MIEPKQIYEHLLFTFWVVYSGLVVGEDGGWGGRGVGGGGVSNHHNQVDGGWGGRGVGGGGVSNHHKQERDSREIS